MESIFSRLRRKNGYFQLFNSCWKVLTQTILYLLFCLLFAFPLSTHCSLSFPSLTFLSPSPSHSLFSPSLFPFLCLPLSNHFSLSLFFHPTLPLFHLSLSLPLPLISSVPLSLPLSPPPSLSPILSISSWDSLACFSFYLIKRFYFYFNLFLF